MNRALSKFWLIITTAQQQDSPPTCILFLKFCLFHHNLLLTLQSKLKMSKHKTSLKGFSTLFELFRSFMFPLSILIQKKLRYQLLNLLLSQKKYDRLGWAYKRNKHFVLPTPRLIISTFSLISSFSYTLQKMRIPHILSGFLKSK